MSRALLFDALKALEGVKDAKWDADSVDGRRLIAALRAALAEQPAASVVLTDAQIDAATCSERDALIDEIYEHGLNMEGILRRTTKFARAAIAAAIPPGHVVCKVEKD